MDEQRLIDAICAQLLEQPAAYADPTAHASYTTAFWEDEQMRVPPASQAQLRATEAELSFPLPPFLRALYSRVANGGRGLGHDGDFYGAEGGWPNRLLDRERTIGQLVSRSGWRLHERVEAALMRHPGSYLLSDESPDGFIEVADYGCAISVEVDRHTGRVYYIGPAGSIPLDSGEEVHLRTIEFAAPSLAEWFRRHLDPTHEDAPTEEGELAADSVDVSGLDDPDIVWRGLYRLGPQEPEEPETPPGDYLPWWDGAADEVDEQFPDDDAYDTLTPPDDPEWPDPQAIKEQPERLDALLIWSADRMQRGEEGGFALFEWLLAHGLMTPTTSEGWSSLAYLYGTIDWRHEAAEAQAQVTALAPNDAAAWERYGDALLLAQCSAGAAIAYGRALALRGLAAPSKDTRAGVIRPSDIPPPLLCGRPPAPGASSRCTPTSASSVRRWVAGQRSPPRWR